MKHNSVTGSPRFGASAQPALSAPLHSLRALVAGAAVACAALLPFGALAQEGTDMVALGTTGGSPSAALPADGVSAPARASSSVASVNINTASAGELAAALNGVGAARAEAIIRYREMYGPFESVEELAEVSGIGAATIERNRSLITLN